MKRNVGGNQNSNRQFVNKKNRPEIRDDMDHREGEEQESKGDDVTHNEKETKKQHLKEKKKDKDSE